MPTPLKPLPASEVRNRYLRFFEEQGHKRLPSDSLVPSNDPTLLFTGAGMNQFKESFLGKGNLPWKRVTTSQKCLRVPDLENVGRTPRHHTFFEMLGNFSFGDYFKRECIRWEWDFFTEALGFDRDRLWVTVYLDDDEAFSIWNKEIGLPAERIYRFGEKENFWPAEAPSKGPNGPCGPCSELYWDMKPGGAPPARTMADGSPLKAMPDERFLEVGNCVFTQFDRRDGGVLQPLPQKNIDVGLGLERIVAVLQGAPNNFETDLFWPYLRELERRSKRKYETTSRDGIRMRRIADHLRAVTFCISDGARPSNEGRGYVVRKILRRACRDLYDLGITEPALHELSALVVSSMGDEYPELGRNAAAVASFLRGEEERFREVYVRGSDHLEELFERAKGTQQIAGDAAFHLHDTLGFPIDLIEQIAQERGFSVDVDGFEKAMEDQRERARAGSSMAKEIFVEGPASMLRTRGAAATQFTGYADSESAYASPGRLVVDGARVIGIVVDGKLVGEAQAGAEGRDVEVILDRTPFYAEGGGQVGDRGVIESASARLSVHQTSKIEQYAFHRARLERGALREGELVRASVDGALRLSTERHHTATHLLHLALKTILGTHVNQAGSHVAPDRLRFDFTHPQRLTPEQIRAIEDFVNERVLRAQPVSKREMTMEEAKSSGAVMLFGEKYGDRVRVLGACDSTELCGGTHVGNTGNIGIFKILSEASAAAGIRRIEAVCGPLVVQALREQESLLEDIAKELKAPAPSAVEKVKQLRAELKAAKDAKAKASAMDPAQARDLLQKSLHPIADGSAAVAVLPGVAPEDLRGMIDAARKQAPDSAWILFAPAEDQVPFVVSLFGAPAKRLKAGDLAKAIGPKIGGGGGGRPDFAQGQGKNPAGLQEAVAAARALLGLPPQ